ncbi:MAG: FGGY-family carbohydrate kinase [Defluviitaleaceae bacterium]|nr:FGGY-family carbohydrate kinase [Defluviitaleaceae bacterium]
MEQKLFLGIEFGSTRIKAVLIGEDFEPLAIGAHTWENQFEGGHWTYAYDAVWAGLQDAYGQLAARYAEKFGAKLTHLDGIGISAMMHGYIPLDADGRELAAFRTWRNTNTGDAAAALSERFGFNIPLRWSIAHVYQAMLNGEAHIKDIAFVTSLAGYVHYKLTGENILGAGDASGVFPVEDGGAAYHAGMMRSFAEMCNELVVNCNQPENEPVAISNRLPATICAEGVVTADSVRDIFPQILPAGVQAGALTVEGAALLDPTGALQAGIPFCPPEGDAGTGMVATNSIAARTGNISAGTSIFAMIVLERSLSRLYPEIDMVTTPDGKPVAMVHCNNCSTEIDAWVRLFAESARQINIGNTIGSDNGIGNDNSNDNSYNDANGNTPLSDAHLSVAYNELYRLALQGEPDGGGITAVSYHSGEHNTGFDEGRPLVVRTPDARFTPANVMRTLLHSAMATLKLGMANITEKEAVRVEKIHGHGGLFTVKGAAQKLMAGALNTAVTVLDTASEGGAWGIALLAAFPQHEAADLDSFLRDYVFKNKTGSTIEPALEDVQGFAQYMERFVAALDVARTAVEKL